MPVRDEKLAALRAAHALNPAPETVRDPAFTSGDPFFDPRDVVQVKYEMLRRVAREGHSVTSAAAAFGFSRPSFYAAQAAWQAGGLPGLLPARPGPRHGHKLTPDVVAFLRDYQTQHPTVRRAQLLEVLYERFGVRVHRRTLERALAPKPKKTLTGPGSLPGPAAAHELGAHYETLRSSAHERAVLQPGQACCSGAGWRSGWGPTMARHLRKRPHHWPRNRRIRLCSWVAPNAPAPWCVC